MDKLGAVDDMAPLSAVHRDGDKAYGIVNQCNAPGRLDAKHCKLSSKYNYNTSTSTLHAYISVMKSIADMCRMKPLVDNTPSRRSTDTPRVRMVAQNPGSVLSQGITLFRIAAVVLSLYLKFKLGLWLHRRRDGSGDG
jgi:hypothetical protein